MESFWTTTFFFHHQYPIIHSPIQPQWWLNQSCPFYSNKKCYFSPSLRRVTLMAFIANEIFVLWYYIILITNYVLTYWKYVICRVFPFPDKLSHQQVHLLKQLHSAAGTTRAITTVNCQQSTDHFPCSGKKSRELYINTQNVCACLCTHQMSYLFHIH